MFHLSHSAAELSSTRTTQSPPCPRSAVRCNDHLHMLFPPAAHLVGKGECRKAESRVGEPAKLQAYTFVAACLAHAIRARHPIPCVSLPSAVESSCDLAMVGENRTDAATAHPALREWNIVVGARGVWCGEALQRHHYYTTAQSLSLPASSSSSSQKNPVSRLLRLLGPSSEQGSRWRRCRTPAPCQPLANNIIIIINQPFPARAEFHVVSDVTSHSQPSQITPRPLHHSSRQQRGRVIISSLRTAEATPPQDFDAFQLMREGPGGQKRDSSPARPRSGTGLG